MIEIFGKKVNSGEKLYFTINGPMYAHMAVPQIPVIVVAGGREGATLWINGAVHGHEVCGSHAMWELMNELDANDISGNIIITPIANIAAFIERKMKANIDDHVNMDTQFPGNKNGIFSQRTAKILYDEIKLKADVLLSFHALTSFSDGEPYTIVKRIAAADKDITKKAEELAYAVGYKANCIMELAENNGSIDAMCILDKIPAIMVEVGRGGQVSREMADEAKQGTRNVLSYLKMIDCVPKKTEKQYVITKRTLLRSDNAGFMTMSVKPGDIVKKGEELLQIHYFGKEIHSYKAEKDVYILYTTVNPVLNEGDEMIMVGTEWNEIQIIT